jgi:hypothetical protein
MPRRHVAQRARNAALVGSVAAAVGLTGGLAAARATSQHTSAGAAGAATASPTRSVRSDDGFGDDGSPGDAGAFTGSGAVPSSNGPSGGGITISRGS